MTDVCFRRIPMPIRSTSSNANSIDEFQWQFDRPFLVRRNIERHHTHPPIVAFVQRWDDIRLEYFRQGFRHTAFSQFLRSHSNFFSHLKKELKAYLPYLFALFTSETFMQHFPTLTHPSTVFYSKVSLTQSKQ